jgi:hypothetical protein
LSEAGSVCVQSCVLCVACARSGWDIVANIPASDTLMAMALEIFFLGLFLMSIGSNFLPCRWWAEGEAISNP